MNPPLIRPGDNIKLTSIHIYIYFVLDKAAGTGVNVDSEADAVATAARPKLEPRCCYRAQATQSH